MATWRAIIEDALIEIGVLAEGEPSEPGQLAHAGRVLDAMLGQWGAEGLLAPGPTRVEVDVSTAQQFWTMGTETAAGQDPPDIAADFEQIWFVNYTYRGHTDPTTLVQVSPVVWARIKSTVGQLPRYFVFDRGLLPYQRIRFDRDTLVGDSFVIEGRGVFDAVPADLEADSWVTRQYSEAIRQNLGVKLIPAHGVASRVDMALLMRNAMASKTALRRRNANDPEAVLDPGLLGTMGRNYYSGRFSRTSSFFIR